MIVYRAYLLALGVPPSGSLGKAPGLFHGDSRPPSDGEGLEHKENLVARVVFPQEAFQSKILVEKIALPRAAGAPAWEII